MPADELVTKSIHSHMFHLQPDSTFIPYKFQKGKPSIKATKVPKIFFQELAGFLHLNNLVGLITLQLLDGTSNGIITKLLIGPQSTLIINIKDVLGFKTAKITTGWVFRVGEDGIISCKGNSVYAAKKFTYTVFVDGKFLQSLEELKAVLL